jgi:hypothetical protein
VQHRTKLVAVGIVIAILLGGVAAAAATGGPTDLPTNLRSIDGDAPVSEGSVIGQGELQPNGTCLMRQAIGVKGTDQPGEGGTTVLHLDGDCRVTVQSIEKHGPKRLPNGEIDRDAYPAPTMETPSVPADPS